MDVERILSPITRFGVYSSALLLSLGLSMKFTAPSWRLGDVVIQLGFITLISTPIMAVASLAILSAIKRDVKLTITSALVLLILLLGIALGAI
ncbi:MAG TPA: DUF1634 domain-containing protein [Candidatus Bathyarchaeota archaeon]|nr:DUF1634 domain-containing protein [Candidatus Bathyarchaeota archaeon]